MDSDEKTRQERALYQEGDQKVNGDGGGSNENGKKKPKPSGKNKKDSESNSDSESSSESSSSESDDDSDDEDAKRVMDNNTDNNEGDAPAMGTSSYEANRARNIKENQEILNKLGLTDVAKQLVPEKKKKKNSKKATDRSKGDEQGKKPVSQRYERKTYRVSTVLMDI